MLFLFFEMCYVLYLLLFVEYNISFELRQVLYGTSHVTSMTYFNRNFFSIQRQSPYQHITHIVVVIVSEF